MRKIALFIVALSGLLGCAAPFYNTGRIDTKIRQYQFVNGRSRATLAHVIVQNGTDKNLCLVVECIQKNWGWGEKLVEKRIYVSSHREEIIPCLLSPNDFVGTPTRLICATRICGEQR